MGNQVPKKDSYFKSFRKQIECSSLLQVSLLPLAPFQAQGINGIRSEDSSFYLRMRLSRYRVNPVHSDDIHLGLRIHPIGTSIQNLKPLPTKKKVLERYYYRLALVLRGFERTLKRRRILFCALVLNKGRLSQALFLQSPIFDQSSSALYYKSSVQS